MSRPIILWWIPQQKHSIVTTVRSTTREAGKRWGVLRGSFYFSSLCVYLNKLPGTLCVGTGYIGWAWKTCDQQVCAEWGQETSCRLVPRQSSIAMPSTGHSPPRTKLFPNTHARGIQRLFPGKGSVGLHSGLRTQQWRTVSSPASGSASAACTPQSGASCHPRCTCVSAGACTCNLGTSLGGSCLAGPVLHSKVASPGWTWISSEILNMKLALNI